MPLRTQCGSCRVDGAEANTHERITAIRQHPARACAHNTAHYVYHRSYCILKHFSQIGGARRLILIYLFFWNAHRFGLSARAPGGWWKMCGARWKLKKIWRHAWHWALERSAENNEHRWVCWERITYCILIWLVERPEICVLSGSTRLRRRCAEMRSESYNCQRRCAGCFCIWL